MLLVWLSRMITACYYSQSLDCIRILRTTHYTLFIILLILFPKLGGNSGIGKVMVQELSRHGAHVISTARSHDKCSQSISDIKESLKVPDDSTLEKHKYGKVECLILDLASFRSIEKFRNELKKRSKKVNGIILNAGIMMSPYSTTAEGFESQLGVNYIGHWYLINQLEQIIRNSKNMKNPLRIVTVASNAHEGSYPEGTYLTYNPHTSTRVL